MSAPSCVIDGERVEITDPDTLEAIQEGKELLDRVQQLMITRMRDPEGLARYQLGDQVDMLGRLIDFAPWSGGAS